MDTDGLQASTLDKAEAGTSNVISTSNKQGEDIMSVLLAHERKGATNASNAVKSVIPQESSDSSDNEDPDMQTVDAG